jgi:tetratricopeptide (TPR) repeat protein
MLKKRSFWVFLILLFCFSLAGAQDTLDSEQLFSPSLGQKFYEIAYELANSEDINGPKIEQALVFLTATLDLDSRANYVHPVLIKLVSQHPGRDYSEMVYNLLTKYLDKSADFEPARQAVQYLLERLNSREQREELLAGLLQNLSGKNACFDSELATLLGLLVAEKADANAAQVYFIQAFNSNKYNKLAFAKLVELAPEQIAPVIYLEHLRLALGENPLDLEAALAFAQYAERVQLYQTAADAYEYCAQLFSYLYPSQALPSHIYLPWTLNSYNTPRNQHNCLQIVSQLRQSGRFDLFAEAIASKAALKIGDTEQANRILQAVEEKINNPSSIPLLSGIEGINTQSTAWFYCFASPDANKALHWANKAYSAEPNSATAAALLAYSLVMNEQIEWATPLIDKYERNQIADLTLAQIQLTQGQRDLAIETLKSAIAKDPASLEAELAKEILGRNGGEYVPPIDPDITLTALRSSFGQAIVPEFTKPEKIISAQLNVRGSDFSYGSNLDGVIAITNISSEPLVVSDDGLFTGSIRVDANLTGDLNKNIPNLTSVKIRPASPIKPGTSFFAPLHLPTGELRNLLLSHPQASVDIEFTLYLDPVTTDQGRIISSIPDLKPATVIIKRHRVEIIDSFLKNRIGSLTKGQPGQKIKTAQLFIGLLMEHYAMANREPLYKFTYTDSMPPLLNSALLNSLASDDWAVKVHIMADMTSLPLDYDFLNALSENLNDTHWPVRLMALYLLAKNQDSSFTKVLDWAAKYDSSKSVRDMAVALGGTPPPPPPSQELAAQPTQGRPQQQSPALGGTAPESAKPTNPPTQGRSQRPAEPNKPAMQPKQSNPQPTEPNK